MTARRKWATRAAGVAVMLVAGVGTWAAVNATELRAKFAARQLISATTDDERARCAESLIGYGEPGARELVECVKAGAEPARAAATALEKHLESLPDNDPRALTVAEAILGALPEASDPGRCALLNLFPAVLKRTASTHARRCRSLVVDSLKSADAEVRLEAARLAIHPDLKVRAELKPLLADADARVRGAALFAAAAPADGELTLGDEELFRWLHDPDSGVRKICRDALIARDRSESEIALGRRLTDPNPTERLKLLMNLRYDEDVSDPEPWLERLSRDPEPAVRAGAARVAVEVAAARRLPVPVWVARVADADPHPTVRFVAAFYRTQSPPRPEPVRPASGP